MRIWLKELNDRYRNYDWFCELKATMKQKVFAGNYQDSVTESVRFTMRIKNVNGNCSIGRKQVLPEKRCRSCRPELFVVVGKKKSIVQRTLDFNRVVQTRDLVPLYLPMLQIQCGHQIETILFDTESYIRMAGATKFLPLLCDSNDTRAVSHIHQPGYNMGFSCERHTSPNHTWWKVGNPTLNSWENNKGAACKGDFGCNCQAFFKPIHNDFISQKPYYLVLIHFHTNYSAATYTIHSIAKVGLHRSGATHTSTPKPGR